MKFTLFQGCNIPARLGQYADATEAVLGMLSVDLLEVDDFNCCGYPSRNTNHRAFILSAAQNMAVAEKYGLDMLVMCKCCYGSLKMAAHLLSLDPVLKADINAILAKENLHYDGSIRVVHLLSLLYHDVGLERLKAKISSPFTGLQIAVSYGCHALRPSHVTCFDHPVAPKIFDELVESTGAYSVDWSRKLECCGAPLTGINDRLAMDMTREKIASAKKAGVHFMCTACPYCQLQFDWVQHRMATHSEGWEPLASILYPQLLGLSMGLDAEVLGLSKNGIDLSRITSFFSGSHHAKN
jgi:heterodisulfide reductase subunit B